MTNRKGWTFALVLLTLDCPDMPHALDLFEADTKVSDDKLPAESHATSPWLQQPFPDFSFWLLRKLLDDSLEVLAFGCCVCWVCTRASQKFLSNTANSGDWDSKQVFWELLPFYMLIFGSIVLLVIMGAASSWDTPAELVLLLLLIPVVCLAFGLRRCPMLLQWLLCCGLFLQILHHGVEHAQSHMEKAPLTTVSCGESAFTKKNLRMVNGGSTNLDQNFRQLTNHTSHLENKATYEDNQDKETVMLQSWYDEKEIATLKSMVDIQTKRIQALTAENKNETMYDKKRSLNVRVNDGYSGQAHPSFNCRDPNAAI